MEFLDILDLLEFACATLAIAGIAQSIAGWLAVRRFRMPARPPAPAFRPAITILKPLHGDEPMLEQALATLCAQEYPKFQVVFGVQSAEDTALPVVQRLAARFPGVDIALVIDPTAHGRNRKIGNLINMFPEARHDVIVLADSDVHVAPDYLDRVVEELQRPGTGLVTALYTGLPANGGIPATLGATWITHGFLPGALMARVLGRQDCLGGTMALRRSTLVAIGGLAALAHHLADDNVLGRLVRARGFRVGLARTVTATTVPETTLPALFRHELRWSRTILALVPREFVLSSIQHTLFWALAAIVASGFDGWSLALFLSAWVVRATAARDIDATLARTHANLASPAPIWLLPLRDLISMAVMLASYGGDEVEWRGNMMSTGRTGPYQPTGARKLMETELS